MQFIDLTQQDRRDRIVLVLRSLVAESGYTQRAFATAIGISKSQVGHVLTGQRRVEYTELVDWLKALEIDIAKFSELLNEPPSNS